jgi:hypothetical protein
VRRRGSKSRFLDHRRGDLWDRIGGSCRETLDGARAGEVGGLNIDRLRCGWGRPGRAWLGHATGQGVMHSSNIE